MENLKNITLDTMSVRELMELQADIQAAVKAAIRQQNEQRAMAAAPPAANKVVDLERERDAWLARRRAGPSGR
jgi:hypothetical protein